MEHQARYDLNAAVENWRQELAAQPALTEEARRELETHLLDAIAGFQRSGLSEEEAFWLARRRVGQPQQLGEEFVKVDPAAVWRERVFWMALALLANSFWSGAVMSIPFRLWVPDSSWARVNFARMLLHLIPPIWLGVILARGTAVERFPRLKGLLTSRRRFGYCAIVLLVVTHGYPALGFFRALLGPHHGRAVDSVNGLLVGASSFIGWPLLLLALAVWLMPGEKTQTLKRV